MCYNLLVAKHGKKIAEKELYEPIRRYLIRELRRGFSNYHLEVTARGAYTETLKHLVRHDIVFSFLRKARPDLTGFVLKENADVNVASFSDVRFFITVEVKLDKIQLKDIFQAKMQGDLFYAKYALLISLDTIGEEIGRLQDKLCILNRFRDWKVYVGQVIIQQLDKRTITVKDIIWRTGNPF